MSTPPITTLKQDPRTLLTDAQFTGVVNTVLDNNPGMTQGLAERITAEAVKFVVAGATHPGIPLAPSRVVDEGWHALILHTRPYAQLCAEHGPFVHHSPGYDPTFYDPDILTRTTDAIRRAGFTVDEALWAGPTDGNISVAAQCQHSPPECAIEPQKEPKHPGS
jgi:hypothetical protein